MNSQTNHNDNTHSGAKHGLDKLGDVLGGMLGRAKAQTVGAHSSAQFIENAAIGDRYEIEAAHIALARSRSPEVRDAAQWMIADHTMMTNQLKSALRMNETEGLPDIPLALDSRRAKLIEHLETAPGDDFDQTWIDQQVLGHKETHDLLSGYARAGDNPQLRSLAAAGAPVVLRHLAHMERLRAEHTA